MHVEIDVFEIILLVFFYFFFKWSFRLVILVVIGRLIGQLKEKGEEKLNEVRDRFNFERDTKE